MAVFEDCQATMLTTQPPQLVELLVLYHHNNATPLPLCSAYTTFCERGAQLSIVPQTACLREPLVSGKNVVDCQARW